MGDKEQIYGDGGLTLSKVGDGTNLFLLEDSDLKSRVYLSIWNISEMLKAAEGSRASL